MEIKAVKFRKDGFYSQPFAFGGEEGPQAFDPNVRYRGSLQNYLIDTGDEVILVDTARKMAPNQVSLWEDFLMKSAVGWPGRMPGTKPPFFFRLLAISLGSK